MNLSETNRQTFPHKPQILPTWGSFSAVEAAVDTQTMIQQDRRLTIKPPQRGISFNNDGVDGTRCLIASEAASYRNIWVQNIYALGSTPPY